MKHRHHLIGLVAVLVLALAAFTGSALAGGGHGHGDEGTGNGHDQQAQTQAQVDASAQAQADAQAKAAADAQARADAHAHAKAAANASTHGSAAKQSSTSAASPATGGVNSQGVKPSSSTKHETYAAASSNQTKQYGSGKTAGQIATAAGYGAATLHGPGNSQPHKTNCGEKHEVDVHALKNKSATCGTTGHVSAPLKHEEKAEVKAEANNGASAAAHLHVTICHATGSSTHPYVMISPSASGVLHGHLGHQDHRDIVPAFTVNGQTYSQNATTAGMAVFTAGCTAGPAAAAQVSTQATTQVSTPVQSTTQASTQAGVAGTQATTQSSNTPSSNKQSSDTQSSTPAASTGGVLGATATGAQPQSKPSGSGGVLGTSTRLGGTVGSRNLPFTGLPLWIFAAAAAGLILTGVAVRRSAANRA
jgi:hypothetical protein